MSGLVETLRRVQDDLVRQGVSFALVGGLAMSVRATPRFTRDIDLAVAVADDGQAEATSRGMFAAGYRLLAQIEQEGTGRLATVRFVPPSASGPAVVVDLLFASCGIEPEIVDAAEPIELESGVVVPVATREHLIAMKVLARDDRNRPQDHDDLVAMIQRALPGEIERATEALRLIESRGFARGRDLCASFRALVRDVSADIDPASPRELRPPPAGG